MSEGELVDGEEMEIELPPQLERLIEQMNDDRKRLLKTAAYGKDPNQLRQFMAQFLIPRMTALVELLGVATYDVYQLSSSNARQLHKLHRWTAKGLREAGVEVNDNDLLKEGVGDDIIEQFSGAVYALGTMLQQKLPDDAEVQTAYNKVADSFAQLLAELQGEQGFDEDEDEDEDGAGESDEKPETSEPADDKKE